MRGLRLAAAAVSGFLICTGTGSAASFFSFNGNFTADDNVQLFNLSVGATSNVEFRTWSYAGGTNAAGQVIPEGGFDPILALFGSTGALFAQNAPSATGVAQAASRASPNSRLRCTCTDISTPNPTITVIIADPPCETSGSGTPPTGIAPITMAMLTNT